MPKRYCPWWQWTKTKRGPTAIILRLSNKINWIFCNHYHSAIHSFSLYTTSQQATDFFTGTIYRDRWVNKITLDNIIALQELKRKNVHLRCCHGVATLEDDTCPLGKSSRTAKKNEQGEKKNASHPEIKLLVAPRDHYQRLDKTSFTTTTI